MKDLVETIAKALVENPDEVVVTSEESGKSIRIENAESDPRFDGTLFDDLGLRVKTMLCVPLTASGETMSGTHPTAPCVAIASTENAAQTAILATNKQLFICRRLPWFFHPVQKEK